MAKSLILPTLASSALVAALLLVFQKHQNTNSLAEDGIDEELFGQDRGDFSQNKFNYSEHSPTRSSRPNKTRKDLLIEERARLTLGGLGPQHPRIHTFNILIDDSIASVNRPARSREFLLKESTKVVREQATLRRQKEALFARGLGNQHPTALAINEQLEELTLAKEVLQKQIQKKALSLEESAF